MFSYFANKNQSDDFFHLLTSTLETDFGEKSSGRDEKNKGDLFTVLREELELSFNLKMSEKYFFYIYLYFLKSKRDPSFLQEVLDLM